MEYCTPLRFVVDTPEYRGRLGGNAPVGVKPRFRDADTSYFATIPLSETHDVSIFISTSDSDQNRHVFNLVHQIHDQGCEFIEAVVHKPAKRSIRSKYWELVSPVSLCPLPQMPDVDPHWEDCRYMDHKFGGKPGLIPGSQHWDEPLRRVFDNRFQLMLQIAFPSSEDSDMEGNWPFGELNFYLFGRHHRREHEFKFLWTR